MQLKHRLKSMSAGQHSADCGNFSDVGVPGLGDAKVILLVDTSNVLGFDCVVVIVLIVEGVFSFSKCDGVVVAWMELLKE